MKKRILLSIGLIFILLPLLNSSNVIYSKNNTSLPNNFAKNDVQVDTAAKLYYNLSRFDYGQGIFDMLDMLWSQSGIPGFDAGFVESLEGSEIVFYIMYMDTIDLYKYNETHGYHDPRPTTALDVMYYLNLKEDLLLYANLSQISYPESTISQKYRDYYENWPRTNFTEDISSDTFWSSCNSSFISEFDRGWIDQSMWISNPSYDYLNPSMYEPYNLGGWGNMVGSYYGYWIGQNAYMASSGDGWWSNATDALDGFYVGFFYARDDGFGEGQTDYTLNNKIPDERYTTLPYGMNETSIAYNMIYEHLYIDYYQQGYFYEGAQEYFNEGLYRNLYQADTYWDGYVQGYMNHYYQGYWDGENDRTTPNPKYTSYDVPDFYSEYGHDPTSDRDEGDAVGMVDGYNAGYEEGFVDINFDMFDNYYFLYSQGLMSYIYDANNDGFYNGTSDALALIPANNDPATLPYDPSTTDPFEIGANEDYLNTNSAYRSSYDNGYLFATLANSDNPLDYMAHAGPFYNISIPDLEFTLLAGSILPFLNYQFIMYGELNLTLFGEYMYNPSINYWPFYGLQMPGFTIYAPDTDWTALDMYDLAWNASTPEQPGFNTTYDPVDQSFIFRMFQNYTMEMDMYFGFNTSTAKLLNVTSSLYNYYMPDFWFDIMFELDDSKTEILTVPTTPSSWTYLIEDFVFYYDIPPTAPINFVNQVHWFKMNGTNAIGNPVMQVEHKEYLGLWCRENLTLYNPGDPLEPPNVLGDTWYPMVLGGNGFQLLPEWDMYDGMWTSVTSIFNLDTYFVNYFNALASINSNIDVNKIELNLSNGHYYYAADDVKYYYISIATELDFVLDMLDINFEWLEISLIDSFANATIWVGFDYTTGILLGSGLLASFRAEVSQVPDFGMSGAIAGYIEIQVGSTIRSILNPYEVFLIDPRISEFSLISILGILSFLAFSSAVIFTKRRK